MKKKASKSVSKISSVYDHLKIEKKWQADWKKSGIYKTKEGGKKPKAYVLDMFPYPSGSGLHVGHPKGYIATDVFARFKRMSGFNVLHPMGWDAFGLPAEEFALKNKIHPSIAVKTNVKCYKDQLSILGFCYDWDREVNTTDPEYYKWTQWAFLQMHKKGLTYESHEPINWCPSCKTGLANEDLDNGKCERCGSIVEKKPIRQWVIGITKYADRLLSDLDALDWPNSIKESQKNWIGRSEGSELTFEIKGGESVSVFTTRPDTIFGVTYLVLAPEHHLIEKIKPRIENWDKVQSFIKDVAKKTQIERTAEGKEKTGVHLSGISAVNPANGEKVPVWIADYVLADYGTGAVMAVPAHDERDFVFAKKYNLPIMAVIGSEHVSDEKAYTGGGTLINSGKFNGKDSESVIKEITKFCNGKLVVRYKLRDWVFSRQRYWGEPIPLVHCASCGVVPVPEKELPLKLPNVKFYEPTGTGESPLAAIDKWVNTKCPQCKGPAKRETNTMPQWAGSCWYYLRYMDPKNKKMLVDPKKEKYWSPVDVYVGGTEHATRHLIYARFWHKFLYDIGVVSQSEPFTQLRNQGLIMGPDGQKMSKRFGNVVNPDDIVKLYGADSLRVYEMFMGPFEQAISWSTDNMLGSRRFIERVWRLKQKISKDSVKKDTEQLLHKTIKKVGQDIQGFSHNTAISSMMILLNALESEASVDKKTYETLLLILAPFTPHITDDLWSQLGHKKSIHLEVWPTYDESKLISDSFKIMIQVNGKIRGSLETNNPEEAFVIKAAKEKPEIKKYLDGNEIIKEIYVKNKLVNFVVKG
ncbi:MAG: leucine--tRNA ligase [bacterium]